MKTEIESPHEQNIKTLIDYVSNTKGLIKDLYENREKVNKTIQSAIHSFCFINAHFGCETRMFYFLGFPPRDWIDTEQEYTQEVEQIARQVKQIFETILSDFKKLKG